MAYADPFDVAEQWRALSSAETSRAEALLDMAAILIGHHVDLAGYTSTDPLMRVARQVSIDMVIEALAPGFRSGAFSSYSVQMDGAVESATLREGADTSTITLTRGMLALFGLSQSGQMPAGSFGDCE